MYRTHTLKFAYIFGSWARKTQHFLLRWKFSLFSTQQKCAGNNRNKTNRLSASFCTKNHQIIFSSLRERVVWSCVVGFKIVTKIKTHTSRLHTMYVSVKVTYIKHYWQHMHYLCVFVFETFLKSPMQLQSTRSRRLLNGFWSFLVQNKVESLLVLFSLFPAHFCWCESNVNFQWNKKLCFFLVQILKM